MHIFLSLIFILTSLGHRRVVAIMVAKDSFVTKEAKRMKKKNEAERA